MSRASRQTVGVASVGVSEMPNSRKDGNGNHGYGAPVAWIVLLLCGYWVISEWNSLPALISSAIGAIK
jgi:hypothetical protein